MKYINFKRFKFSTIFKKIKSKGYDFSKIFKFNGLKVYNFSKILKLGGLKIYDFLKILKFNNLQRLLLKKIYSLYKIKIIIFYSFAAIIFSSFLYLAIPTFYKYEKSSIANLICNIDKIECIVAGEVKYRFYPTPRLKINDITVNHALERKKTIINLEEVIIKLSLKNLWDKKKQKIKNLELNKFVISLAVEDLKKYKNILNQDSSFFPITFKSGQIIFFNKNEKISSIDNANLSLKLDSFLKKAELKGKFLNDNIYIKLNKNNEKKSLTEILLKMSTLNLFVKASLFDSSSDQNTVTSNILIKKDKNRFTGVIDYKNNKIKISKSHLRNTFLDGKLTGIIEFIPYFNFNLDLSLNSLNFTKLYNYFLALDKNDQENIFKINKKINGKLGLSSDRVYSGYNLVKSFESRMKFNNGNIILEQFLINLGKLGAADLVGTINNDKKFTNFKYESNIFIDNQKKFLGKFGIYNKQSIPSNLFISGNFDLQNIRGSFYEISDDEKLKENDINFIEKEFNEYMLDEGYKNLFYFPKFKNFIKSITSEN